MIDNKINVSGLTLMDLKNMLDSTLDFLLAAPIILVVGIFLPRIVMFVLMKVGKNNKRFRNYQYIVRLTTTIAQILLELSVIVGMIIILQKSQLVLFIVNIPGAICYILIFLWTLCFDIYHSCVHKRYWDKAKSKMDKKNGVASLSKSLDFDSTRG